MVDKPTTEAQVMASRYADVFSSPNGRIVLENLISLFAGDEQCDFVRTPNGYDPLEAAIRNGRRQTVNHIKNRVKVGAAPKPKPKQKKAKS